MKNVRTLALCLAAVLPLAGRAETSRPNVLFIAVDDLRAELACYGSDHVKSPHIDRLASRGTLFERAYCQQAVCNPSRASLMTGLRPDTLRVWDLPTHFRETTPDAVTLPQLFKRHGYHAQAVGKIYHNWRQDDWKGDPGSWSVPSVLHYNNHSHDKPQVEGTLPPNLASGERGMACRDVPDDAYFDGRVATTAIETLRGLSRKDQPFFLAVGFWKPHGPFNAPKKYWDLYDREKLRMPEHVTPPEDVPEIALTGSRYKGGRDAEILREMQHGYLAAISYLDAQVGRVVSEVDRLGLGAKTIIVFWSDHGLHVGEHGLLRKTTAFELDARVPLIIASPHHNVRQRTRSLVELVDLYPTLVELCGLDAPHELEGVSLVPVLRNPAHAVKRAALTQAPRPNYLRGEAPRVMGYSLRTARYRYTEWRDHQTGAVNARELYDHEVDPLETVNRARRAEHTAALTALATELRETLRSQAAHRDASARRRPDPVINPESPLMLDLKATGADAAAIDFNALRRIPHEHSVISDVRDRGGRWVHQHAYLAHHDGLYFAMWSDGPGVPKKGATAKEHRNLTPGHDQPDTRVSYAISEDGVRWTGPRELSGPPRTPGFGWIARGLWQREGELLALASHFNAPGYSGKGLSLEAFRWTGGDRGWQAHGTVLDDTLNNFPPKKLPTGEYLATRRDHQKQVSVIVGGHQAFDRWEILPLATYSDKEKPEEPYWYILPDGKNIVGLIRDNSGSKRLLRTFSIDNGRTWSRIVRTNFPDATSKFFVLRTSRGYYAMVSNSNPHRRDPLTLAISHDGLVFTELFYLVGGRHVDYPHIIERNGHLLIAFSGAKQTMEVLKVDLNDLDELIKTGPSAR